MAHKVFLSYRRDHGAETARLIRSELRERGYDAFLDVEDIGPAFFDEKLLREIENADHFVLILTPGALDRCGEPEDWLCREITHALETARNVIPLLKDNFAFPPHERLPAGIRDVARRNGVEYSHRYFRATIEELVSFLTVPEAKGSLPAVPPAAIRASAAPSTVPPKPRDEGSTQAVPVVSEARIGLALYASAAMKKLYGVRDGGSPFDPPPANVIEPVVHSMANRLASAAVNGKVNLVYWPCGSDSSQVQDVGLVDSRQAQSLPITGPVQLGFGRMVRLTPALKHLVDGVFRDAPRALGLFLNAGKLDDYAEVEFYSRSLDQRIASGQRPPLKLVLIGLGDRVDEAQMSKLEKLCAGSGLWKYRLAKDLRELDAITAELLARECRF